VYNYDDEDPLDQNYNPNFDRFGTTTTTTTSRRAKTLERDHSFNNENKSRFGYDTIDGVDDGVVGTDYALRSRTLDDRLGNKRGSRGGFLRRKSS
jgi:hypothetical protein